MKTDSDLYLWFATVSMAIIGIPLAVWWFDIHPLFIVVSVAITPVWCFLGVHILDLKAKLARGRELYGEDIFK